MVFRARQCYNWKCEILALAGYCLEADVNGLSCKGQQAASPPDLPAEEELRFIQERYDGLLAEKARLETQYTEDRRRWRKFKVWLFTDVTALVTLRSEESARI